MAVKDNPDSRRIKSVDQAFEIIDFVDEEGATTLSEIADELDMPVSTAHIHLVTLVHNGYLRKVKGGYRCSFRFLQTGGRMRDGMTLFRAAKPEIDELQEETGEHANIMVEEDGYTVQLYKSAGAETIDDDAPTGQYFYSHETATGKAMLAQMPRDNVEAIIDELGLPPSTNKTITDEDTLYDELESIQELGYAINREEHYQGVYAVGTAIESEVDGVLGAISVSGPLGRMGSDRIENDLAPALLAKKNIIELKLRQRG